MTIIEFPITDIGSALSAIDILCDFGKQMSDNPKIEEWVNLPAPELLAKDKSTIDAQDASLWGEILGLWALHGMINSETLRSESEYIATAESYDRILSALADSVDFTPTTEEKGFPGVAGVSGQGSFQEVEYGSFLGIPTISFGAGL
jgi:hypothetical protein